MLSTSTQAACFRPVQRVGPVPVRHAGCSTCLPFKRHYTRPLRAIEEKRETSGTEASSAPSDLLSEDQTKRLAELRRQQKSPAAPASSNVVQGALEEAQLISWPSPGKALLDTVLVLAIVASTGVLLFGANVLLNDASNWWYRH
eukprot:jgi/Chrzof1/11295/Cz05g31130.t1